MNRFGGASLFDVLTDSAAPQNARFRAILSGEADSETEAEQLFVGPNQRDYVSQGVQTRAEITGETGPVSHRAEAGLRFHYDRIERRHSEDPYNVVGGNIVATGEPTLVTTLNEADTFALAAYVSDDLQWSGLTLTPGRTARAHPFPLRGSPVRRRAETVAGRAAGGSWRPLCSVGFFGVLVGAHRGMSPPSPGAENDPEISLNYEGGVRYLSGRRRAEVIGYYNDYQNLTDICTLSSGCDEANLDRQFEAGRLASTARGPGRRRAQLRRLSRAAERLVYADTDRISPRPSNPRTPSSARSRRVTSCRTSLDTRGARPWGSISTSLGGTWRPTYVGRMREQSGSGPLDLALATDEQLTLDLGLHYQVLPKLRLYAQARNLLDGQFIASRRPYGARPNPPRWIQLGAELALD